MFKQHKQDVVIHVLIPAIQVVVAVVELVVLAHVKAVVVVARLHAEQVVQVT